MAGPKLSEGPPRSENYNPGVGFEYRDPRIDDDVALAAGRRLNESKGTIRDAGAIEIQFDRLRHGKYGLSEEYMVPGWVAENGLKSVSRREGVLRMLSEMGRATGLDPQVIDQVKGMYRDGIASQELARSRGLRPYGLRPGELGTWQR